MYHSARHPCVGSLAGACVSLNIARNCNLRCGFCDGSFGCAVHGRREERSQALTPQQAIVKLRASVERGKVAIACVVGPGEPFAEPAIALETVALVRDRFPDLPVCVSTNGLEVGAFVPDLAELGVSCAAVSVNAVDPRIGAMLYDWVRIGAYRLSGIEGALSLIERQEEAVRALKAAGMTVRVDTTVIPGVNDTHIASVAAKALEWGADSMDCRPFAPLPGSRFQGRPAPSAESMEMHRRAAAAFLRQSGECRCGLEEAAPGTGPADPAEIEGSWGPMAQGTGLSLPA